MKQNNEKIAACNALMDPTFHTSRPGGLEFCTYFQAQGIKKKVWFVMGCVRSHDNWAFARTYDKKNSVLEFFVAPAYTKDFVSLLQYLQNNGYISSFQQLPNRIQTGDVQL